MEWPKELVALFDDPLLEGVKPKAAPVTADARMQKNIDELHEWVEQQGREPEIESKNMSEKLLAVRLRTLKDLGLWI